MQLSKLFSWILRMILIISVFITMGATLGSTATVQVNTAGLVRHTINRVAKESGNADVQNGIALFQALGVEDSFVENLPKKLSGKTSMMNFHNFANSYLDTGKLTVSNLHLSNKTDQEKTVNDLVLNFANDQLKDYKADINQALNYYNIFYYIVIALYVIAMLLIIFNRRIAFVPLLIASGGSYAIIGYGANALGQMLQSQVYSGIHVTLDNGFAMSLILAIIISVIWFAIAGLGKNHMLKKKTYTGKHTE